MTLFTLRRCLPMNERLIVCYISGYRADGPYTKKAYDLLCMPRPECSASQERQTTPPRSAPPLRKYFYGKLLDMPGLVKDARFIDTTARSRNRHAATARQLEEAGIANGILRDMPTVWRHSQLKARKRSRSIQTENGPVPSFIAPAMSAHLVPRLDPIPSRGQHNEKIDAEFDSQD
ncbi:hypothetical protein DV736_g1869, partial [Chaetothyriales sp. CBS 134916]